MCQSETFRDLFSKPCLSFVSFALTTNARQFGKMFLSTAELMIDGFHHHTPYLPPFFVLYGSVFLGHPAQNVQRRSLHDMEYILYKESCTSMCYTVLMSLPRTYHQPQNIETRRLACPRSDGLDD